MNHAGAPSYLKGEFFKALPAAARADLEPLLAPSSYPSNVVLFTETQPSSGIYVILDGEVKLSINSSDGRRLVSTSPRLARCWAFHPHSRVANTK
jgi:CRP-like cAMP-binding protein